MKKMTPHWVEFKILPTVEFGDFGKLIKNRGKCCDKVAASTVCKEL
jgi:hypothetical protein